MLKTRGSSFLRFWDRYLGVPAILFLSVFRKKRPFPKNIQRIGLIKLAGIGDLVLLSSMIQDLKKVGEVILFCGPDNLAIASYIPGIKIEMVRVTKPLEAIRRLRRHQLDLLLDFEQWSRIDALLTFFSGARWTCGFRTPGQYKHYLFDQVADHSKDFHEIDNFRKVAGILEKSPPLLQFPPQNLPFPKRFVLLHPWSSSNARKLKEWPREYWHELGHFFKKEGYSVFITGGKGDIRASEELATTIQGESLAGKIDFAELASYIQKATCVISIDTGVMHLTSALQRPLIALFGPTSPKRWGPLNPNAIVVTGGTPYMYLGFEVPKNPPDCMRKIKPVAVISAFQSLQKR